jgi:hypothetical protein
MRVLAVSLLLQLVSLPAADLVLHYSFNEGSGGIVRDRSGHGLHGRRLGGSYVVSDRGMALRLDGIDDRVEYTDFDTKGMPASFTLLVRLRVDVQAGAGTTRLIFGDVASRSVLRNFNLKLDKYERIHAEWGNGESFVQVHAPAKELAGGWHMLAVVGDPVEQQALLYVDGRRVAQAEAAYGPRLIGGAPRFRSGSWWARNAFQGDLDDLKVYAGVLTQEEIQAMNSKVTEADRETDHGQPVAALPDAGMAPPVNRTGLVADYTFEEGSGERLLDHSGRGNHGQIHGAQWVASPWGDALRFDGVDDYVDLGQPEDFWFGDGLTIEMWVKTIRPDPPRGHPLLIGSSAADLAVERHFNFRLDHTGYLRFEWGNRNRYREVTTDPWFLAGEWRHLAVVFAAGKTVFVYVNGTCVEAQSVALPLTRTRGDSIHIGGWYHGYLQGDVAGIRIYRRALSAAEIQAEGGTPVEQRKPVLRVTGNYSYHQNEFLATVLWSVATDTVVAAEFQILDPGHDHVLGNRCLEGDALRSGLREGSARLSISARPSGVEDHHLRVTLRDNAGQQVLSAETPVPYVPPPEWLGSEVGSEDRVLPPYTPCELARDGADSVVSVWGRRYRFGSGTLLSGIDSGGTPLLNGPVSLRATASDRPITWGGEPPTTTGQKPTRVRLETELHAKPFLVQVRTMVEFDGFIRFDCEVGATEESQLDSLELRIPLAADCTRLLHAWPMDMHGHSGALAGEWSAPFRPILWVGNEERGLSWSCESERNWYPADPQRAMEIVQQDGAPVLVCHLVGRKRLLRAGETLAYTFALQATPVRSVTRTFWDMRLHRSPPYANEYQWPQLTVAGKPKLKFLADSGARARLVWRWWDAFGYPLPLGHEERFPALVQACHGTGMQVVPYAIGFLLSDAAPEFRTFRADMLTEPEKPFTGVNRLPGLAPQMAYFVCPNSCWRDFAVAKTAACMDRYDTDGVYLDTTVRPEPCTNRLHGCGWVRPDGTVAPTYPIFAIRDLMKRLYSVVLSRKPNGFVDAHVYDCLNVPALAFATGMWNGEQLPHTKVVTEALPLDRFRTEFLGRNIGVPADLLYYKLRNYEAATALALVHDVPVRCESDDDMAAIASVYRIRSAFGCSHARFHGYWDLKSPVRAQTDGCWASSWLHPRNGVLVAVANLAPEERKVHVQVDWMALPKAPAYGVHDMRTGTVIGTDKQGFTIPLASQSWGLVWLRPGRGGR